MLTLCAGEPCRAKIDGKWVSAVVQKVNKNGKSMVVSVDGVIGSRTLALHHTQKLKKKTSKKCSRGEVIPSKRARLPPWRLPSPLPVEGVTFEGPGKHGDYAYMLRESTDKDYLHIYNENVYQWANKSDCSPGGGNACARPYRHSGKVVGIPTGESGAGFSSLEARSVTFPDYTVEQIIDEALNEATALLLKGKYKGIYFCVDPHDQLLGTGIYRVDNAVRAYITKGIKSLPQRLRLSMYARRQAQRA